VEFLRVFFSVELDFKIFGSKAVGDLVAVAAEDACVLIERSDDKLAGFGVMAIYLDILLVDFYALYV
jgi:hypothetical protein